MALRFPVPKATTSLSTDLMTHFTRYFSAYLDPSIIAIKFKQLLDLCYLEVSRQPEKDGAIIKTQEEISLDGLEAPEEPALDYLRSNEAALKFCDEYDWIIISDLFPENIANKIAKEWERPGGKLDQKRSNFNEEL